MLNRQKRLNRLEVRECRSVAGLFSLLSLLSIFGLLSFAASGCSSPANNIPSIPKNHPAQKFYQSAQLGMLSDNVCRENQGDPTIPAGKISQGNGYTKTAELAPGVFRFQDIASGKKYLGVSFLQYTGLLQIPKVCAWEEKK